MKIKIYKICKIINIVFIIDLLIMVFADILEINIFNNIIHPIFFSTLAIITQLFWVYNYYIYYVKDKSSVGLKLLFFNIFYTPFYTKRVLENGWLNKEKVNESDKIKEGIRMKIHRRLKDYNKGNEIILIDN